MSPIERCPGPRVGSNPQMEKFTQILAVWISIQHTNSQRKDVSDVEAAPSDRLSVCLCPPRRHRRRSCCGSGETCASLTIQLSLLLWRSVPPSSRSSSGAPKKRKVQAPLWLWAELVCDFMWPSSKNITDLTAIKHTFSCFR